MDSKASWQLSRLIAGLIVLFSIFYNGSTFANTSNDSFLCRYNNSDVECKFPELSDWSYRACTGGWSGWSQQIAECLARGNSWKSGDPSYCDGENKPDGSLQGEVDFISKVYKTDCGVASVSNFNTWGDGANNAYWCGSAQHFLNDKPIFQHSNPIVITTNKNSVDGACTNKNESTANHIFRERKNLGCPTGYKSSGYLGSNEYNNYLFCIKDTNILDTNSGFYLEPDQELNNCDKEGNPCNPISGAKTQVEMDYNSNLSGLNFHRVYNSYGEFRSDPTLAVGWRHPYSKSLVNLTARYNPQWRKEAQAFVSGAPSSNTSTSLSKDESYTGDHSLKNVCSGLTNEDSSGGGSGTYSTTELACHQGWINLKGSAFGGKFSNTTRYTTYKQIAAISSAFEITKLVTPLPYKTAFLSGGQKCVVYDKITKEAVATLNIRKVGDNCPAGGAYAGNESDILERVEYAVIGSDGSSHHFFLNLATKTIELAATSIFSKKPEVSLKALPDYEMLFTDRDGTQEIYDKKGRIKKIIYVGGVTLDLNHDANKDSGGDGNPNTLDIVTNQFGQSLRFKYENGSLVELITPEGTIFYNTSSYTYKNTQQKRLDSVQNLDGTKRQYTYDSSNKLLTSIVDENGVTYAQWSYDSQGRVTSSQHAGGVEGVGFTYHSDNRTTVKTISGAERTYYYDLFAGELRTYKLEGDICTDCNDGHMKLRSYDANGNLNLVGQ